MKKIVVLYHANCPDGFGSAWAAWKKFGGKAEYIPILPRELPEKKLVGRNIYALDNSFPVAVQRELRKKNRSVVVIDHHESAKKDVEAFPENVFSNNKNSGSVLSWRYFHPETLVPMLLKYVEDTDLWAFKLPHSREIGSYIFQHEFDFRVWNTLRSALESAAGKKHAIAVGSAIEKFSGMVVEEAVKRSYEVVFAGHRVWANNSSSKRFQSQIGNALARKHPPMGVVWWLDGKELHVSLRSEGNFDVSKIAKRFNEGGGHKNAAGFTMPFKGRFPWKVIKK